MLQSLVKRRVLIMATLAIALAASLSGCNTIGGMGEDVAWAGNAIADTAESVGE